VTVARLEATLAVAGCVDVEAGAADGLGSVTPWAKEKTGGYALK
jgi:hypothetical protein